MRLTSRLSTALPADDDAVVEKRAVFRIKVEVGFALLLVRTVALEAVVREDRPDVAVEIHRRRFSREGGARGFWVRQPMAHPEARCRDRNRPDARRPAHVCR